ncbi:MAG: hypothetical protein IPJ08_07755 [Burkholderiales bacterium]|nr:hypothetical protein [Burkholderiales bacterium]
MVRNLPGWGQLPANQPHCTSRAIQCLRVALIERSDGSKPALQPAQWSLREICGLAVTSRSFATVCTVIPATPSIKATILLKEDRACNEGVARDDKQHCAYERCTNANRSCTRAVACEVVQHNTERVGTGARLRTDPVATVVLERFLYGVLLTIHLELAKGAIFRSEQLVALGQTHTGDRGRNSTGRAPAHERAHLERMHCALGIAEFVDSHVVTANV